MVQVQLPLLNVNEDGESTHLASVGAVLVPQPPHLSAYSLYIGTSWLGRGLSFPSSYRTAIDAGDVTARQIVSFNTAIIRAISRWSAARETVGDTGYQPAWRIPVNLDRGYQPDDSRDDLKRTEFGQGEAHLHDAFR